MWVEDVWLVGGVQPYGCPHPELAALFLPQSCSSFQYPRGPTHRGTPKTKRAISQGTKSHTHHLVCDLKDSVWDTISSDSTPTTHTHWVTDCALMSNGNQQLGAMKEYRFPPVILIDSLGGFSAIIFFHKPVISFSHCHFPISRHH